MLSLIQYGVPIFCLVVYIHKLNIIIFFKMLTSFSLDQILDMGLKRNFVPVTLCAQGMILFQETYN